MKKTVVLSIALLASIPTASYTRISTIRLAALAGIAVPMSVTYMQSYTSTTKQNKFLAATLKTGSTIAEAMSALALGFRDLSDNLYQELPDGQPSEETIQLRLQEPAPLALEIPEPLAPVEITQEAQPEQELELEPEPEPIQELSTQEEPEQA